MIGISAVIITFNEERNIRRCLESLEGIAEEIIVVDSFSTDKTRDICKNFAVTFIQHPFTGHIEQKNFALTQATNDYVLSLDADEAVSPGLKTAILDVKNNPHKDGYTMNRLSNYCGKWIHHGSWYPDTKLRFFNRHKTRWCGINPHDKAELTPGGTLEHLKGDLFHYSYYAVDEHLRKLDYFSTIAAESYFNAKKKAGLFKIIINPAFAFFRDYFLRFGFLDGYYGLIIAYLTAFYTRMKYVKLKFLQDKTNV
jgi:glycosyltransferase involved in cell wall biosynthesis